MPRIRTIKPQHWSDKELPNISLQAHLLWLATWNFSDDEGIFEADVHLIKSQAFPRRTDIRTEQIEQWIGQLVKARFVIPFTYNGGGYYISRTFKTHQKIDKPQKSKIPKEVIINVLSTVPESLEDHSITIPRIFDEQSTTGRPSRVEESSSRVEVEESSGIAPPPIDLCYDIESYLLKNEKEFQVICMNTQKNSDQVRFVLQKFHLWNIENSKYPKAKLPLIAGLKKWILNEKNFPKNGNAHTGNNKEKPEPTGNVPTGGFGQF